MAMSITIQGRLDQFQDNDFVVRYNPKGDGNCQFSTSLVQDFTLAQR